MIYYLHLYNFQFTDLRNENQRGRSPAAVEAVCGKLSGLWKNNGTNWEPAADRACEIMSERLKNELIIGKARVCCIKLIR